MIERWQEQIQAARDGGKSLRIRGGGSKDFYGGQTSGEILDTSDWAGLISYEPTELVVTAKAGTPLVELGATLHEHDQMLGFEPPQYGPATVGGAVACGLSGPRRARAGALRDFVLGTSLLDGQGQHLEFGGQVMKNVAGYDVSRLLAGSLGTLGVITQVSLKVLPRPRREQTRVIDIDEAQALATMCRWAALPLPISATAWHDGVLHVRLSGAVSAVAAAARSIGGEALDDNVAAFFWADIKEHRAAFFADSDSALWRLALPAGTPALAMGDTMLEWNGTQRWLRSTLPAGELRTRVGELGGHATLFRGGDKSVGVFTPLADALVIIQQNLKREFDPQQVFNRGRMYSWL